MHCSRQCGEMLVGNLTRGSAQLGSDCSRIRCYYAAVLRAIILQFDFSGLTVETVSQIRKLHAARIIPRQPSRNAEAKRSFFFKAECIHGENHSEQGGNKHLIRQLAK